jgi:uncharacterized membrane protein YfbV (UPF0208 family)
MERRKLTSAALVLTLLGALLFMPPLASVFQVQQRVLGIPAEVIYLFFVWVLLVVGAWWLGKRLPHEGEDEG